MLSQSSGDNGDNGIHTTIEEIAMMDDRDLNCPLKTKTGKSKLSFGAGLLGKSFVSGVGGAYTE